MKTKSLFVKGGDGQRLHTLKRRRPVMLCCDAMWRLLVERQSQGDSTKTISPYNTHSLFRTNWTIAILVQAPSSIAMGNSSSSFSLFAAPLHPPPSSSLFAQVLLTDGTVLRFSYPIKVIYLLLDYPQHFICPLQSLRRNHCSLPSLLPDEELKLGQLYLLLPFRMFQCPGTAQAPESAIQWPALDEVSVYGALKELQKSGEKERLLIRNNSHLCYSESECKESQPSLSNVSSLKEKGAGSSVSNSGCDNNSEQQSVSRSYKIRRSRTWTPRLQAIREGKKSTGKNS